MKDLRVSIGDKQSYHPEAFLKKHQRKNNLVVI